MKEHSKTAAGPANTSAFSTKLSASIGLVAAMTLAVFANIIAARHYHRFDVTESRLFTLSPATQKTLHELEEPLVIHVLLGAGDPQSVSLQHLLEAYKAESPRIEVTQTDPDRAPAKFLALQQKYGLVVGKTDDGRIAADAAVIVVRGDRPYFLTQRDLVAVEESSDVRVRSRLEYAVTSAIRNVVDPERARICFSTGHGEKSLEVGGPSGLADLRDRLVKNNYEPVDFEISKESGLPTSLAPCRVVAIIGPTTAFSNEEAALLRQFIEGQGGSALVALGVVPDATAERYPELNSALLLDPLGVHLDPSLVFERLGEQRTAAGYGETFMPKVSPHRLTEPLVAASKRGLRVVVTLASSLSATGGGRGAVAPLLTTSDQAFGMRDFFRWAQNPSSKPEPLASDPLGPLTVADAIEFPPVSQAVRGARAVVTGSPSMFFGATWQNPELYGTAMFVENAFAWLAARPPMLDIPEKPAQRVAFQLTEDALAAVFRYVVFFMPLTVMLLGLAVHLRRRNDRRGQSPTETERPM